MKKWYAKSKRPGQKQVEVKEHLQDVCALSTAFGRALGMEAEAGTAGQLHDVGKYSEKFQNVLKGTASRVDHAMVGAAFLWKYLMDTGGYTAEQLGRSCYAPILEAINAHHGELRSYDELRCQLAACMEEQNWLEGNDGKEVALTGEENYRRLGDVFREDFPEWKRIPAKRMRLTQEARMLWTRILLSCLVDADYTASAAEDGAPAPEAPPCQAERWLQRLTAYRDQLTKNSTADTGLNRLRNELFDTCGRAGDQKPGLYTLTAPTGTGKTLALLHFALRQCVANGQQRIIIVLPFITLTEQNADEYRKILGDDVLLEDHSQRQLTEEQRFFAQRWDMPVIVTTSVRFFEALFADKAPSLRKLHQLANSVIVFDEAQSLPAELLPATLRTVQALCDLPAQNITMLFSTATQPDFHAIPNLEWTAEEICPHSADMYQALRRVQVEWRILLEERAPFSQIAREMAVEKSVCAIVNLKKHAKKLFVSLQLLCEPDSVFYMTTELCPAHRRVVIDQIKKRLAAHLPCRVVATQCIEAGVDLDFDCVYRALAPLEAVIQAAGRCNRNGRIPGGGRVVVFVPDEENLYPDLWYEKAAMQVSALQAEKPIDIQDPAEITRYYRRLFRQLPGNQELAAAIRDQSYGRVEQAYHLIKNDGIQVLVPYAAKSKEFEQLKEEALTRGVTAQWMRNAAPLCVTVYPTDQTIRFAEQLFFAGNYGETSGSDYWVLRRAEDYHEDTGICLESDSLCFA